MEKIKILFLAANPKGAIPLAIDEEIREITYKIRLSNERDVLDIVSAWAVRPDDLLQYLNQHKPQIVHFSGHGSSAGEIILEDRNKNIKPVSSQVLKTLFTTLKDNIQLVVLNACYSRIQGKAINKVIDYVIGMNTAVGDDAAIVFAASLYHALGFERTVQEAFDQAKTALLLEGILEANTPELLVRAGVSPDKQLIKMQAASDLLLRSRGEEAAEPRLAQLRSRTTDRDIAFLLAGARAITFPVTLSEHSASLSPLGEQWIPETKEAATARARKLIALGLMEERGASEVETSDLGRAVVAFDESLKVGRRTANKA